MQRNRSMVVLNLIYSLGFGILIGTVFPFYVQLFGVNFQTNTQFFVFFASCIAAGTLVGFVAFLINKITIIRMIDAISEDLKKIALGQGDLRQSIQMDSSDEIGKLVYWFNTFLHSLDKMIGDTKRMANVLWRGYVKFGSNLRYVRDVLQTVSASQRELENLSSKQIELIDLTTKRSQDFESMITSLSGKSTTLLDNWKDFTHYVQKQYNLTQEFGNHVDSLRDSLGDPNRNGERNDGSDLLGVTMQFTKESTKSIGEQTQRFTKIEKLLEEIEDIAESTHLLSINASIEAARAGDSGRGFTIVALQIRNLATNSGSLTAQIREQIDAIMSVARNSGGQLADLRGTLVTNMEKVLLDVEQLGNCAKDVNKATTIISSMHDKLKERVEDIGYRFTEANAEQGIFLKPLKDLAKCTEDLRTGINRINLGSIDVEKTARNFFEQGVTAERQLQELIESMENYRTSRDRTESNEAESTSPDQTQHEPLRKPSAEPLVASANMPDIAENSSVEDAVEPPADNSSFEQEEAPSPSA